MPPVASRLVCCVCGRGNRCRNRNDQTRPVKLHLFPKDARRRMQWLKLLNIAYVKSTQSICDEHFEDIYISRTGRLTSTAVPKPVDGVRDESSLAPLDSTVGSSSTTTLDLLHNECPDVCEPSKVPDKRKTVKNTDPKAGMVPLNYKKFVGTNFGKISFSKTPDLQTPESPIQTANLVEDVLLHADHGGDWNDSNSDVNIPGDMEQQVMEVPQTSIQTSAGVKNNTLLNIDLGGARGPEPRRREASSERRTGIIVPQCKERPVGAREAIDVPDTTPSDDLLPLSYKCDTTYYGKITFSNTSHQDEDNPETSIRASSLEEDTLDQVNLGRDGCDTTTDVNLASDVPQQEVISGQPPSQTENMEDDMLHDTGDLVGESPTPEGEEQQSIDAPETCRKCLTESATSAREEEPEMMDASVSCRKRPAPEDSEPPSPVIEYSNKSSNFPEGPAPEDSEPSSPVIEYSNKSTNFPEVPMQVKKPLRSRRHCQGCCAAHGTCMGVKTVRNTLIRPTQNIGIQVTQRTPQTSEWSTQTDVKMVDCGAQTSITGQDLKPYENKHFKYVEAMHRKCTTDYIMKDDTTCIAFTGLTVACLVYLHKYLKDKADNLEFFQTTRRQSQQYWANQIQKLSTLEAFLLCLTHLRRGIEPGNLACMFRVATGHITMFTFTWISFLHQELSFLNRRSPEGQEEDESSSSTYVSKARLVKEYRLLQQPKQLNTEDIREKALSVCEALWNLQP